MDVEPQPKSFGLQLAIAVALLLGSVVAIILLGKLSWVVPITFLHISALAYVRQKFFIPGFSNSGTKIGFAILGLLTLAMAAGETKPHSDQRTDPQSTKNKTRPPELTAEAGANTKGQRPPPDSGPTTTPSSPPRLPRVGDTAPRPTIREVTTTVDEILQTYANNQIAGERKFSGAKVTVRGRAIRVREALGTGILVLGSPRTGKTLELYFEESGETSLSGVAPGQPVTAICYGVVEVMGAIVVTNCRSVR